MQVKTQVGYMVTIYHTERDKSYVLKLLQDSMEDVIDELEDLDFTLDDIEDARIVRMSESELEAYITEIESDLDRL